MADGDRRPARDPGDLGRDPERIGHNRAMTPTYDEIAYRESERLIATQVQSFDELRSRTGLLLAATAITGSFLGAAALEREDDLGFFGGAALLAFAVGIGACLVILWPKKDAYKFVLSPKILLESWSGGRYGDPAAMQRFIATKREEHYDENKSRIDRLFTAFQVAALAIGLQVILWTLQLTTGG